VNDVVGDNPEPEHAMLNLGKFDFRTAAGRFRGDDGGARASARHDIALNALFARNLYREAFNDESYAGRARFMRDMESCCTDD
jgi:hypothetical protein